MDTNDLRRLHMAAVQDTETGLLWPNGLGFDARGTSYTFSEREGHWLARTRQGRLGRGSTPAAALTDARRQPKP